MNPAYETVIDASTIVWTLSAMLIHIAVLVSQVCLCLHLFATGIHNLFFSHLDTTLLRRLGAIRIVPNATKSIGALRLGLAIALLLPLVVGASFLFSLAACLGTLILFLFLERGLPADIAAVGRWPRHAAIALCVLLAAFMLWEGEDGLDLGVEIIATSQGWRIHELEWQLTNDLEAPKVGELAPDFELQDPAGEVAVRLSDFRGKRPVALIFGSYT